MAILEWDKTGERYYEMGVKKGVLYTKKAKSGESGKDDPYGTATAWNGLTSVSESPDGAEATDLWADDTKYATFRSLETFGGTIECYTYPKEWEQCDGSVAIVPGLNIGQQGRAVFGLAYRTSVGSDVDTEMTQYKLHLVYGATASPSEKSYESINDSPDAITFSYDFETTPVSVAGYKDTSILTLDSREVPAEKMKALEDILYGTAEVDGRLPMPAEVIDIIKGDSAASAATEGIGA